MNLGGWAISDPDERGARHVVPLNDDREHMDEDCPCGPRRDCECPSMWVHNSFDKRELYETGARKIS